MSAIVTVNPETTTLYEVPKHFGRWIETELHIQDLRRKHAAIAAEIEGTLAVEREHREALETIAGRLSNEIALYPKDARMADLDHDYERLDLSFLAWKQTSWTTVPLRGLVGINTPRFALFSPESASVRMHFWRGIDWSAQGCPERAVWSTHPSLPDWLLEYFNLGWPAQSREFDCRFRGAIPPESREIIREAQKSKRFEQIYLVQEAKWNASIQVVDPLIVGTLNEYAWLLGAFDLTASEDYVRKNYTK